jgi:hypothetical protein
MRVKQVAFGLALLALGAVVAVAVVREVRQPEAAPSAAAAFTAGLAMDNHESHTRALTAEEESYAAALWAIHNDVKLSAIRMTFAGLKYKTEHHDASKLKATVEPLTLSFRSAAQRARAIQPPPSLADTHKSYVGAVDQYAAATQEMLRVVGDGRDEHLLAAQKKSEKASETLLKVSDVLWPGEYKPN